MDILVQAKGERIGRWIRLGFLILLALTGLVCREEYFSSLRKRVLVIRLGLICLSLFISLFLTLREGKRKKGEGGFPFLRKKRKGGFLLEGEGEPLSEGEGGLLPSLIFALLCLPYGYLVGELLLTKYDSHYGLASSFIGTSIFTPKYVALNLLLLAFLCLFFVALTGNIKAGALGGISFHVFFGIVNYYVYFFRGRRLPIVTLPVRVRP